MKFDSSSSQRSRNTLRFPVGLSSASSKRKPLFCGVFTLRIPTGVSVYFFRWVLTKVLFKFSLSLKTIAIFADFFKEKINLLAN